ncbi:hypothetical protein ACQ33O_11670 [Ferruginibacter sp. SUN002]|uniref:hypothetical protein n=1 Tax=Ferruginibacter sp. SUN002 TaxID=2937789 RepID=UPI003D36C60E
MKSICLLLVMTLPFFTMAQNSPSKDSAAYYRCELAKLWHKYRDSMLRSEEYASLNAKLNNLPVDKRKYVSFNMFADVVHNDYSKFNQSITAAGFTELEPISFRFGCGITVKSKRNIHDIGFFSVGLKNQAQRGNETIKSFFSNVMQYDYGFDLLQSNAVSIYPYAGLSIRASMLRYEQPMQINPGTTNISDLVIPNGSAYLSSTKIGYQAGLGIDVTVSNFNNSRGSVILFAKGGTNGPIGRERYKTNDSDITYNYDIRHADWMITFGIKFAGRD